MEQDQKESFQGAMIKVNTTPNDWIIGYVHDIVEIPKADGTSSTGIVVENRKLAFEKEAGRSLSVESDIPHKAVVTVGVKAKETHSILDFTAEGQKEVRENLRHHRGVFSEFNYDPV